MRGTLTRKLGYRLPMRAPKLLRTALWGAGLSLLILGSACSAAPPEPDETLVKAEEADPNDIGFPTVEPIRIDAANHTDAQVDHLLTTLSGLVAKQTDETKWQKDAEIHFWRLQNRLERARMSEAQESKVVAAIDAMAMAHPAAKDYLEHRKWMVQNLGIGKVAPDIVGKDLDGVEFKLSDSRGKVAVVVFTGEWCGPCRSEYPYQRLMLDVYKDKAFALLGVNSDGDIEVARKGKVEHELPYRAWWDGHAEKNTGGPIATQYGVTGWPTIYILDHEGVIRFAGLRHEDSLKAVSQLMADLPKPE